MYILLIICSSIGFMSIFVLTRALVARMNRIKLSAKISNMNMRSPITLSNKARALAGLFEANLAKSTLFGRFYCHSVKKVRRSGCNGKYDALIYIVFRAVVPGIYFLISCAGGLSHAAGGLAGSVALCMIPEIIMSSRHKKMKRLFDKNAYRIYQYIFNQTSSGIRIHEAIGNLYEIIDEGALREALLKMSAKYELTRDIDAAVEEVRACFSFQEAETLCIALKQGVATGDNSNMIARQEEVMFNKYLNHIQTETDFCKTKCLIIVSVFVIIMVIMVSIPLFMDVTESMSKIFQF